MLRSQTSKYVLDFFTRSISLFGTHMWRREGEIERHQPSEQCIWRVTRANREKTKTFYSDINYRNYAALRIQWRLDKWQQDLEMLITPHPGPDNAMPPEQPHARLGANVQVAEYTIVSSVFTSYQCCEVVTLSHFLSAIKSSDISELLTFVKMKIENDMFVAARNDVQTQCLQTRW